MENEDEKDVKVKGVTKKGKARKSEPEPLTKKQELNDHIVLMRKSVRKGRVHLINKLTKDIKRLRERKGAQVAKEKAQRKADRIVQEIQLIKHLKEDRVSIYALQDKKNLAETLENLESSTEERTLARLSHCPSVQLQVRKYRESNPYWELQIPVLLERNKDKRRKINKKLAEREALKNNKKQVVKSESEVQSADKEELSLPSDDSEEEETETSPQEETTSSPDIVKAKPKTLKPKVVKAKVQPLKQQTKKPLKSKAASKPEKKGTGPKIEKSQGSVRVQVLNNLTDLENGEEAQVKLTAEDTDEIPKKRPKSSFFVGGEEEIPKIVEERPPQPSKPRKERRALLKSAEPKPIFRKGKLVNPGPKRFKTDPPKRNSQYFKGDESSSNLTPLGTKPVRKSEGPKISKEISSTSTSIPSEKIHPSWEAKKRQQTSLVAFKGKKTTFNDD